MAEIFANATLMPQTVHLQFCIYFALFIFIGSIWAIWYHLLGGIRHLIWDTGRALDVATAEMMGWGMVGGSILLTLITIVIL